MRFLLISILMISALLLNSTEDVSANPRRGQHKRTAAEQSKSAEQRQQEPSVPLVVFQTAQAALSEALHTIRAQEEAAAKNNHPQKDDWDKAAVIANYLLFIVACLYTYFAWGQWGEIKVQARIAADSLRLSQRAAIGIKSMSFKLAKKPEVMLIMENFGRSSATRVRPQTRTYADADPPEKTNYLTQAKLLPQMMEEIAAELMPNVPAVVPLQTSELPDEWVDAIKAKKAYVYLVGRILYFDGFENAETPLFCYWISTENGLAIPVWHSPTT